MDKDQLIYPQTLTMPKVTHIYDCLLLKQVINQMGALLFYIKYKKKNQ
jgi:hypothetical protein